jgi:hypothetical protein
MNFFNNLLTVQILTSLIMLVAGLHIMWMNYCIAKPLLRSTNGDIDYTRWLSDADYLTIGPVFPENLSQPLMKNIHFLQDTDDVKIFGWDNTSQTWDLLDTVQYTAETLQSKPTDVILSSSWM